MSWFNGIGFLGGRTNNVPANEIPDIFPLPILKDDFIRIDVENIYKRILLDVFERTFGLNKDQTPLLSDSCLASDRQDGLITMLARAMAKKQDLFLVYMQALNLIRPATEQEKQAITDGYKRIAEPVKLEGGGVGVYVTFKRYIKTDMITFYSALEYLAVGGLWKQANLSKAVQLKFKDMRSSTGLNDAGDIIKQATAIAGGLKEGRDVMLDAEDMIESLKPDMTAMAALNDFIREKRGFYLGLPASYLCDDESTGLGDSGNKDARAIERGLKPYFFSIGKPVVESLFGITVTFKSDDSDSLETALNVLKTMDITSDDYMNADNKTKVVNKAFGFDDDQKGSPSPAVAPGNVKESITKTQAFGGKPPPTA